MPNLETALCDSCSRAVVESGNNWVHVNGTYRCSWPYRGTGWAEPARSFAEAVRAIDDMLDELSPSHNQKEPPQCCQDTYESVTAEIRKLL